MKSFLLIGQSNMAGRGDFGEVSEIRNDKIFVLRNGRWQKMREPVVFDRWYHPEGDLMIHSGVGLSPSFAECFVNEFDEEVGLIPCADGGTNITEWQPGGPLFDSAIFNAKMACRSSELAGILWHQGESDSISIDTVKEYKAKFLNVYNTLMSELNASSIPFVMGEIGDFVKDFNNGQFKYYGDINRIMYEVADEHKNIGVTSVEGLTCKADKLHFNSASYRILGKRYFEKYKEILKGLSK